MVSGIELALDNIATRISDLRLKFSDARKKGLDVSLPNLKFMSAPSKLGVAKATQDYKDIKKVNALLDEVELELTFITQQKHNTSASQPSNQDAQSKAQGALLQADAALQSLERAQMKEAYISLRGIYPFLPSGELKKEIYKKSILLYSELTGSGKESGKRGNS